MPERFSHHESNPDNPSELPPELAEFLKDQPIAALLYGTENAGTILVVKVAGREIESVRGVVPVELRHELYHHPLAPVIRIVTRIYDRPDSSLGLETFVNVEDPDQRTDYAALAEQGELNLLFYDERLQHRLTKRVGQDSTELQNLLAQADWLLGTIRPERFDFDRAKAEIMAAIRL